MNKIIMIGLIGLVVVFSGCITEEDLNDRIIKSKLDLCYENIKNLTCDELEECYYECEIELGHKHAPAVMVNCRDQFKLGLWKCYRCD